MIGMMKLSELVQPLDATLVGEDVIFDSVCTDTRNVNVGDCFVALRGEHFDAHDFLSSAQQAGAMAAVVERVDRSLTIPQLQVTDTVKALGQMGRINRLLFNGPVIGLTGSCGKTTVKEMIAAICAQAGEVHATQGNLNNHIGVPVTLLAMRSKSTHAVIEMGASGLGEIEYLAGLAEPTVSLVNNVMSAHLEGFGSQDGVAAEKSNIYRRLRQGGVAVINLDEPYSQGWMVELQQTRPDLTLKTFSLTRADADVRADQIQLQADGCYQFDLTTGKQFVTIKLPVLGRQNISNALAAVTCALAAGIGLAQVVEGLSTLKPVKGRLVPMVGVHESLVIDDTYNANPGSVQAAAAVLSDLQVQGKQAWLVLGDLGELGDDAEAMLTELGQVLSGMTLAGVLTCGNNSRWVSRSIAATNPDMVSAHFQTQPELVEHLTSLLTNKTVALVKGSRSARMELVVQSITLGGEQ